MHDNYIMGEFGKELRLKEMKLFLQKPYNNQERYLTVEVVNASGRKL